MPTRSARFSQWFGGSRRNVARRALGNFRMAGEFSRGRRGGGPASGAEGLPLAEPQAGGFRGTPETERLRAYQR